MIDKSYKNSDYREIDKAAFATPYLNIYTGQRIIIEAAVVAPKSLYYVEDLNPYQQTISIVMERKIMQEARKQAAENIYKLIKAKLEEEGRNGEFNNSTYTYPVWFEELLEILYYGNLNE